jgi:ribosomal protein S18 acetylase RimI-like enzyme
VDGLTWRPAGTPDAPDIADILAEVARVTPVGIDASVTDVRARLSRPRLDADLDTRLAVDAAGRPVAYAEAADMGVGQDTFRVRLTSAVRPDAPAGTDAAAYRWLLARAAEQRAERHPELPGAVGARCAAADPDRLALLTGHGLELAYWEQDMVRPLDGPVRAEPPAGMRIVPYHRRYDEPARLAHNDAYADVPGALLPDQQTWPQHAVGLDSFLPDASFLALTDDDQIAAFLFSLAVAGGREAQVDCLATRRPWRRRGLATGLIQHALDSYQRAGFRHARLQVRSDNAEAVRVYTALGFADSGRGFALMYGALP